MGKAPPAFQFYAADFAEGTDDLTLTEVGGYMRLLCSQWAKGSIPGDSIQKLAVIMRCTPATAKGVWAAIAGKFTKDDDGHYRNQRLERERVKQAKYRDLQSSRGKESAARRNQASTEPPTKPRIPVEPSRQPEGNPKPQGNSLSLSSSLSSGSDLKRSDQTTSNPSALQPGRTSSPLVMSPIRFAKLQETHAFVGSRLRVPFVLHDEFRAKVGSDEELQAWYSEVNAEVEAQGTKYGDVFDFLRPLFKSWIASRVGDDELRKFREGA